MPLTVKHGVGDPGREDVRLRVIIESAPAGVVMVDPEGRITLVNNLTETLFGYSRTELLGQPIEILVPQRYRTDHAGHRRSFVGNPNTRRMGEGRDLYGLRKDGTEFPVEIGLNPIVTPEGLSVLGVITDITERKRNDERLRVIIESAPAGVVMVDHDGRIALVNTLTETLFGYPRAELLGQSIEMLVPDRYRSGHGDLRQRFLNSPNTRRMGEGRDLHGLRKDGTEFPVEIALNPIITQEGLSVLGVVTDITERKRAEAELRKKTDELLRSNRDLEQFAYVASHDLQEPLRAVAGCVQLLQARYGGKLDARADEFIQHAVDGANRMRTLIDDLLTYSRIGRDEQPSQRVDCNRVLAEALRNLTIAIRESQTEITHDPLPTIQGKAAELTLVFQNLIANAIKFRRSDGPVRVHIGATPRGEEWLLSVKDNGIGIDAPYLERIFVIFQRLHTRQEYPGTGIGLSLCKRVVEHHGGTIWAESTPGAGTTIFFTLREVGDGPGDAVGR